MPASTRYGVFELGMNHAGEIAGLVAQVRPHVAVVTKVAAVHLEHFESVEGIADAKAEIFTGLEGGVAVINRDDDHYARLAEAASPYAGHVFDFGESASAQARLLDYQKVGDAYEITADVLGRRVVYRIGAPGKHIALNSLAALLIALAFDLDVETAAQAFADFTPTPGRGQRETLSIGRRRIYADRRKLQRQSDFHARRAGIAGLDRARRRAGGASRCSATCWSSGRRGADLHAGLAEDLARAKVDLLFTAGPLMSRLYYAAPGDHARRPSRHAARAGGSRAQRNPAGRHRHGQGLERLAHVEDLAAP